MTQRPTLHTVDVTDVITAWAAIAAALFSLVTVFVSTRSARVIEDRRWRRETARRSMLEFLNSADSLHQEWLAASVSHEVRGGAKPALHRPISAFTEDIRKLWQVPRRHLEELELIATPRCVKASRRLVDSMSPKEFAAMTNLLDSPDIDNVALFSQWMARTDQCRQDFVSACRADLGAGRRVRALRWQHGGWLR